MTLKETTYDRLVTNEDVHLFSMISGDRNPIHIDDEAAEASIFGRRVVHGALTASYVSAALAAMGDGVVLCSMDMDYHAPVYPGDTVRVETAIESLLDGKYTVSVYVSVPDRDDGAVASGEAAIVQMAS